MSNLRMLNSFYPSEASGLTKEAKVEQINTMLKERKKPATWEQWVITVEDCEIMEKLIDILTPFNKAILKFEKEKEPTIHHVLPQYYELKDVVSPKATDDDMFRCLRGRLLSLLEMKLGASIDMRHMMGAFLWPKCASLGGLTEPVRLEVHACVRRLCAEQKDILERRRGGEGEGGEGLGGESASAVPAAEEPPPKRARHNDSESDDEYSSVLARWAPAPAMKDEVDIYLSIADPKVKSSHLLQWWKNQSKLLPALSRVARMVLATPASSSPSERRFSVAGRLITDRRNRLAPETVNAILVLHDYLKKKGCLPPKTS